MYILHFPSSFGNLLWLHWGPRTHGICFSGCSSAIFRTLPAKVSTLLRLRVHTPIKPANHVWGLAFCPTLEDTALDQASTQPSDHIKPYQTISKHIKPYQTAYTASTNPRRLCTQSGWCLQSPNVDWSCRSFVRKPCMQARPVQACDAEDSSLVQLQKQRQLGLQRFSSMQCSTYLLPIWFYLHPIAIKMPVFFAL